MLMRALKKASFFAISLYQDFREFLAPSSCLCCGHERDFDDPHLCPKCLSGLRSKNPGGGPVCPFCRSTKESGMRCNFCKIDNPIYLHYWGHYEEELRDCLLQFKFHGALELGGRLIEMATACVGPDLKAAKYDIVIPVPLHKARQRDRMFNQSEFLSRKLADYLDVAHRPEILTRIRKTSQQAKLDDNAKWENVKGAFALSSGAVDAIKGKSILLVDDIVTTGATIYEASRPLAEAGAGKITIFSLAYSR